MRPDQLPAPIPKLPGVGEAVATLEGATGAAPADDEPPRDESGAAERVDRHVLVCRRLDDVRTSGQVLDEGLSGRRRVVLRVDEAFREQ